MTSDCSNEGKSLPSDGCLVASVKHLVVWIQFLNGEVSTKTQDIIITVGTYFLLAVSGESDWAVDNELVTPDQE